MSKTCEVLERQSQTVHTNLKGNPLPVWGVHGLHDRNCGLEVSSFAEQLAVQGNILRKLYICMSADISETHQGSYDRGTTWGE